MIPKRPFLLRAFFDWIVENNMTPHILVNTEAEEVTVPKQHIKDGKIVLNVSPMAVQDFMMDNEALSFSARFSGVAFYIYCPMYSIEAIYARESPADGISFSPDEYADILPAAQDDEPDTKAKGKLAAVSVLNPVSSEDNASAEAEDSADGESEDAEDETENIATAADGSDADDASDDDDKTPPPRKRPALRVVK